ncbi:MAG: SDR family NAD(P)-dependent oxidoreductase [Phormidesmis sp.]
MRLASKVALITSSQRGRCAKTARQLAAAGASVMICGRNAAQGQATVAEIQQAGGRASFILADIALMSDVQAAIDETIATYGRLDILFNNASSSHESDRTLLSVTENTWARIVEATLTGTFFCCQYALPFLQNAGQGSIINLVERDGPAADYTVSGICQGGLVALTQSISAHFSAQGVVANLIVAAPDVLSTPILSTENVLYGPVPLPHSGTDLVKGNDEEANTAFAAVGDAILYLATCDNQLQGYTLLVSSNPHRE